MSRFEPPAGKPSPGSPSKRGVNVTWMDPASQKTFTRTFTDSTEAASVIGTPKKGIDEMMPDRPEDDYAMYLINPGVDTSRPNVLTLSWNEPIPDQDPLELGEPGKVTKNFRPKLTSFPKSNIQNFQVTLNGNDTTSFVLGVNSDEYFFQVDPGVAERVLEWYYA